MISHTNMDETNLNEVEVRFKGRFPIDTKTLDPDKDHIFMVKAAEVDITYHNNMDGTYDKRYTMKVLDVQLTPDKHA